MYARVALCAAAAALCWGTTAYGKWVGGAFVTDPSWNAAASAAIGEQATVFRLFLAFDGGGEGVNSVFNAFMDTNGGELLYQDSLGSDVPPSTAQVSVIPTLEWDSYVSGGNLFSPSLTLTDPSFHFSATGLDDPTFGFGSGWLAIGGWEDPNPELLARAPGSVDQNGALVIPSDFSPSYLYSFQGQFTVLGVDYLESSPVFDAGILHSGFFTGIMDISWAHEQNPSGSLAFETDVLIGVPGPGGAGALVIGGWMGCLRRRRT
jgi:hypothetical protein